MDKNNEKNQSKENVFTNKSFTNNEDDRGFMKDTFNTRLNKNLSNKRIDTMEKQKHIIAMKQKTATMNKETSNLNVSIL